MYEIYILSSVVKPKNVKVRFVDHVIKKIDSTFVGSYLDHVPYINKYYGSYELKR